MSSPGPRAPVEARSEIEIEATPQRVWSVLADVDGWPTWNPAVRSAEIRGSLDVGTPLRWAAGPGTIRSRIEVVEAPGRLAWSGSWMTIRSAYDWRIEPTGSGSAVSATESVRGLIARLLADRFLRTATAELETWVRLLKLEAEERQLDADEEGTPSAPRTAGAG